MCQNYFITFIPKYKNKVVKIFVYRIKQISDILLSAVDDASSMHREELKEFFIFFISGLWYISLTCILASKSFSIFS